MAGGRNDENKRSRSFSASLGGLIQSNWRFSATILAASGLGARPRSPAFADANFALIGSEAVVHAGGDHIGAQARGVRDRRVHKIGGRAAAQIEIEIFDFGA